EVLVVPRGGSVEFAGEEVSDERCGFDGGAGVEKERAGAAGEGVFDGARHFPASCPDDFAGKEWKARVELAGELRVGSGDGLDGGEVGAVDLLPIAGAVRVGEVPAVEFQVRGFGR